MSFLFEAHPIWPPLLALGSAIAYVLSSTRFGVYQEIPWIPLALMLLALAWAAAIVWRRRSAWRFLALGVTAFLAVSYAWWTLDYSVYAGEGDAGADKVEDGETIAALADMELPDHRGETTPLLADDRTTLVVLYRGHW